MDKHGMLCEIDEVSQEQTWDVVKWLGLTRANMGCCKMDEVSHRQTWVNIQGAFDLYQKSVKKIFKDKKTG